MERVEAAPLNQWSELPGGVLDKIVAQLPPDTEQSARLVCKSWRHKLAVEEVVSAKLTRRKLCKLCRECPALKSIDLAFSRQLTASSLRPLSKLTGLVSLRLSGSDGIGNAGRNSLAGLEALAQLRELDVSDMRGSPAAVERICKLTGLTFLDISTHNSERLSLLNHHLAAYLTKLTSLQCLMLGGMRALDNSSSIPHLNEGQLRQILEALPHLITVDLTQTRIGGMALQAFQKHRILKHLYLSGCVSLVDMTGLHGLPRLSALNIDTTPIDMYNNSLGSLPALSRLRVDVHIEDFHAGRKDIGDLTMLHKLSIQPHKVMMTSHWCNQLLQLSRLRELDINIPQGEILDAYNWRTAVGLFKHASLTSLSWTLLQKCSAYSLDLLRQGEVVKEGAVMVPPDESWKLLYKASFVYENCSETGICAGQINLDDWEAWNGFSGCFFTLKFVRVTATQA